MQPMPVVKPAVAIDVTATRVMLSMVSLVFLWFLVQWLGAGAAGWEGAAGLGFGFRTRVAAAM